MKSLPYAMLAGAIALPVHAQQEVAALPTSPEIERITVTGTRIETPIDQVGRAVSVITAEQIELRQQRFAYEAIEGLPGIQLTRSGSFGAVSSVAVRGLDSDQTLVVQDGVVLNNPATFGNSFDFAGFDTADIARIEVIRGAQSTLYGSDAIGGVINIVTEGGEDGFGASGFLEAGSFGTVQGASTVRGGHEKLSGRFTVSGIRTAGFSSADADNGNTEDDGFNTITLSGKGTYQPAERLRLQTVIRYRDSENEFDSFDGVPVDGDEEGLSKSLTAGGFATLDTLEGAVRHRLAVTYRRVDQKNITDGAISFDSRGTRLSYEYKATIEPVECGTLVLGTEYDEQESETAVGFGGNQEIDTISGFGLLQLRPHRRVTLSGGVRHDSSNEFGSETTFNAAGSIRLPVIEATLRGSYSEGFRAPTAGELGFNPALFAEYSDGWDIGLERRFLDERIRLSVTYFEQDVQDLIAFDLAAFTFLNVQAFATEGVELAADFRVSDTLSLMTSYTYLDAFNLSTSLAAGTQPNNAFTAQLAWQPVRPLRLSARIRHNGAEPISGQTLDSFTVLTVRGGYDLTDRIALTARIDNATDANYQDNAGFGTAPLSAYGGVRFRY